MLELCSLCALSVQETALQEFAATSNAQPRMPTKRALLAAGKHDLIRAVERDGGFLEVSQLVGLPARRRPIGYWDNLDMLDQVLLYLRTCILMLGINHISNRADL